jgi:uncharacterized protein YbjT (DUF2867 family)
VVFGMKVLILGATGLVGRNALAQALAQPAVTQVIAPTRKPLAKQDKLMNPVAPKLELLLPEVTGWRPDAAICAIGTTIKKAGSKESFRSVDHDLPLSFARLAHLAGTQNFALVSALRKRRTNRPMLLWRWSSPQTNNSACRFQW